ncbi:hypothetical protein PG985_008238 [Apiospora marii]|uniref:Uncharacterized protein n=1 Tax=Apiospora marii TaxID=335849 RepID=A0ABR1RA23_9PEZI
MAFGTVRDIVERSCPQRAAETIGIVVGQVVMKTPTTVLTPVTKASKTLADSLQVVPVLGGADFTRLPVVGPVLVGIQAALAARELIDRAAHAMDPSAPAEGFSAEEANANAKAVSEALGRPPEIIGTAAAGERLLAEQLAAGCSPLVGGEWATRSRSAEASLPVTQGDQLGRGMKNPAGAVEQVVAKRRLTPLGGVF